MTIINEIEQSLQGLEKLQQKTQMIVFIPQSLLSQRSLDLLTRSYHQHQSEMKQMQQVPSPQELLKAVNIQEESTINLKHSWAAGALKSQTCESQQNNLLMNKKQLDVEVQLNHSSIPASKLLPTRNMVIDLSEDWDWHNCSIVRIVLTQTKGVSRILAIPSFISNIFAKGAMDE